MARNEKISGLAISRLEHERLTGKNGGPSCRRGRRGCVGPSPMDATAFLGDLRGGSNGMEMQRQKEYGEEQ